MPRNKDIWADFEGSRLVFSEGSVDEVSAKTRAYLRKRFETGLTLFLGTTMRDPDLASALFRSKRSARKNQARRIALMPLQGKFGSDTYSDPERNSILVADDLRTSHLGIESWRPTFYGQVSQFLDEVVLCMSPKYVGYHLRIRRWARRWTEANGGDGRSPDFMSKQRFASRLDAVWNEIQRAKCLEHLARGKIELWVRDDIDDRRLTLWASNEMLWLDHKPKKSATIGLEAMSMAAVEAFAMRAVCSGAVQNRGSRWSNYVATPILSDNDQMVVGSVVLMTDQERLAQIEVTTIAELLVEAGKELLAT